MTDDGFNKLWHLFHDIENAGLSAFASNAFVTACFMHYEGEKEAAIKLLKSLFSFIGTENRKTLVSKIFEFLPGNEGVIASKVPANAELGKIIRKMLQM